MSPNFVFAANLRRLATAEGTIAELCRSVGINRQQFNKYLAGSSVPGAATLRRICSYLGIQESSLFLDGSSARPNPRTDLSSRKLGLIDPLTASARNIDFAVPDLQLGNHVCYMPLIGVPGFLVRSLMVVSQVGIYKQFVRLARFPDSSNSMKTLMISRTRGIVIANRTEVYFLGFNRYAPFQCSFVVLRREQESATSFSLGKIMTHGVAGAVASNFVLFKSGENNIRELIRSLGHVSVEDSSLDKIVIAGLRV